jgi:acetyl-CoA carboxylase biotin carboxylase subunit
VVPPYYDPLLAKLIACGADRPGAVSRLRRALGRCEITGVETNLPLHRGLARDPEFIAGGVTTGFLGRYLGCAASDGGRPHE